MLESHSGYSSTIIPLECTIALILDDERIAMFTERLAAEKIGRPANDEDDEELWNTKRDAMNEVIDAAKAKNI